MKAAQIMLFRVSSIYPYIIPSTVRVSFLYSCVHFSHGGFYSAATLYSYLGKTDTCVHAASTVIREPHIVFAHALEHCISGKKNPNAGLPTQRGHSYGAATTRTCKQRINSRWIIQNLLGNSKRESSRARAACILLLYE